MSKKKLFNCLCGHEEAKHNFDPNSAFFGCCEKFFTTIELDRDGMPITPSEKYCKCDEFRPDNLKFLEEKSDAKPKG